LQKSNLTHDDLEYIKDYEESRVRVERYNEGMRKEGHFTGRKEGIEEERKRSEIVIQQAKAEKQQAEMEKQQIELEKQQIELEKQHAELKMTVTRLYFKDQKNISEIADITKASTEFIKKALE
jgi:DNA-directed RNA polymerase alpha subunit